MKRKEFIKRTGLMLAGGATMGFAPVVNAGASEASQPEPDAGERPFPIYDLHVHRSATQDADLIVEKAKKNGIQMYGIVQNVAGYGIANDNDLRAFIAGLKDYPCYIGLQPMEIGWSKNLSPELIEKVDYVLMDPQTVRDSDKYGDTAQVWEHDCYIPDPEEFMEINMKHYMEVINNPERLDIFGWALFLPPSIARDYYRHWTKARMEQIIEAVRARGCALEINDLAHTPHPEFILMAKKAGIKFTFGSDTRDHRTFRLDYCKRVASLCGLTEKDFYIPVRRER